MDPNDQLALRVFKWAKRKNFSYATRVLLLEYGLGIPVERPLIPDIRFDLNMRDADELLSYRFDVRGVVELTDLLGIPNVVITSARDRVVGVEALAILLRRLRYPITYYNMVASFGRSREQICRIFNYMYCEAIHNKGAPLTKVWAFPDGTKIETCRINAASRGAEGLNLQKRIYSGHKRRHCLNFQGLTTPDGLCIHFFGPLEGSRHDVTLLRVSKCKSFSHPTNTFSVVISSTAIQHIQSRSG
ncbi:hypothetical protein H257_11102 [Aphanomyces astaci]|uniref:DDE Tnp4 domain-containing protein n=1 Tax=Aphanomyces astaci TaxID=112090 RepID=W4G363_APHAT|nr:hypothetical protein H257_11102 [Aphanomyces astaci]ETV74137.1 hypothetical protein H257_11102 [Aphanomyces astaci]|eukprot:XP_009836243.1 hypothetical protein H257_11102 [Aphanomyces astaci]